MFGRKSNSFRKKRKFHSDGIRFPFEWNFRLDYFLHRFIDGLHLGKFYEKLQADIDAL